MTLVHFFKGFYVLEEELGTYIDDKDIPSSTNQSSSQSVVLKGMEVVATAERIVEYVTDGGEEDLQTGT